MHLKFTNNTLKEGENVCKP